MCVCFLETVEETKKARYEDRKEILCTSAKIGTVQPIGCKKKVGNQEKKKRRKLLGESDKYSTMGALECGQVTG